jgi:hypothetical protein
VKLEQFYLLQTPMKAAEIKEITGVNHRFMGTMFGLDEESGKKLYKEIIKH